MKAHKQNCWEVMKCGRESGGDKSADLGVCRAATDASFDGLNEGVNAGRMCWSVAGTLCGGEIQGSFAEKRNSCIQCEFFKQVQHEEGAGESHAKFLEYLSSEIKAPVFEDLAMRHVNAGDRFIHQGDVLDAAFIIQRGSCLLITEKDGNLYPMRHLGEGDIVGAISILTGEVQNAHAEAQTDMELWVIKRGQFLDLSERQPDLLDFLTDVVADRFDSKRPAADRAIGKYITTDIIGRGGYSLVYRGYHKYLHLPAAIKMMRHNFALDEDFLANFWNEAKTIAALNHENIINVYDIEEQYRTIFIIMELLEGESLADLISRVGRLTPETAVGFLKQICAGLKYAHDRGILHQDVNPSNIFVTPGDRIKIIDFGVACPTGSGDRSIFDGTIYYMAPEQVKSEPVDHRADIYSLGFTAYEMVTGLRPFPEESLRSVLACHVNKDIPDPAILAPDMPAALRSFILKACQRDPRGRFQDIGQALEALSGMTDRGRGGLFGFPRQDPIDLLVAEHALIRQFLDNLDLAAGRLEYGERPPGRFFELAVEFARIYADRLHHFKEEHIMFVRLALKSDATIDEQLRSLRRQHERGRNYILEIKNSIPGYERGGDFHKNGLLENLRAYIELLRHHIYKEDHHFFRIARDLFTASELAEIAELFSREEEPGLRFFENGRQLLHDMADAL